MPVRASKSYTEALQDYADEYFEETGVPRATTMELAVWALETGRWEAPRNVVLKQCQEDFARALREQYIQDSSGASVRAKHAARIRSGDQQQTFWADIRDAPREHMEAAFQQRREQIVGDCRQLKRDLDYYNTENPSEADIQLVFDFRDDIEEGQFSTEYPPRLPR